MKYLLNKYTLFIFIFVAIYLFDFIIVQVFLPPIFARYPSNITLGMSFIAAFFILIPSIGAYYIVSRHYQNKKTKEEKTKALKNRKITIGLILILAVVLVVKNMAGNKFDPYKLEAVTDKEFIKPLKILIEKKIDENEYYLKETEQGNVSLYQKEGENREDDRYIIDLPFDAKRLRDFWYSSSSNIFFAIENRYFGNNRLEDTIEQIYKFAPNDKERIKVVKTLTRGIYSGGDRILDYFPKSDTLLLEVAGGDGCGGGGSIWTLSGTTSQTLQDFGIGCIASGKPRFIGYNGQYLYFALFDQFQQNPYGDEGALKEIYKMDPQTKSETTINVPNLPDNIRRIELSKDNKSIIITVAIAGDQEKTVNLSLESDSNTQEASSSANN